MRTANLAIVFTDIKGFTERTGRQSHEENQRMLRLHSALLVPVFRAFEGRLVKTIGDAFLVVFESPTRAVLSGVAIQDRLWEYNRGVGEAERIHVRVAINVGEVREEKGDVFGEPVNIAARVEGVAEAGEVMFTEAVYLSMNKAEVPAEDAGTHALKGISTPIHLWRVPRGAYRLEAEPGSEPQQPPYGGLGLARAGKLPPADAESLAKETEIVPQLLARAEALAPVLRSTGEALASRSRPLVERGRRVVEAAGRVWERVPQRRRGAVAGAAAISALFIFWLAERGDPVERALSRGDVAAARQLVQAMPAGPARAYDEGRVDEARGSFGSAATSYAEAARGGDRRGLRQLVRLTKNERCAAREHAAKALGGLGDSGAEGALERLAESRFPDEGEDSLIGQVFGCSSRRAAREALGRVRGGR